MKRSFSLKKTWVFIVLLAVLVPVITLVSWHGISMYTQKIKSALAIERQVNELYKSQIDSEIKRFKTLLINKSDPLSFLIDRVGEAEKLKQINIFLNLIVKREPAIHEAMILSERGEVIADVDPGMGIVSDSFLSPHELQLVAQRAGFNETYESPEVVIPLMGRIYIGTPKQHDDILAFSIAVPIGNPAKAILVGIIDVNKFWPSRLAEVDSIGQVRGYLLDRRGDLLTPIDGSDYKPGDSMTHLPITRSALIDSEWPIDVSYTGVIDKAVYGTLTTIPSLSWTLVSEVAVSGITLPIWMSLLKVIVMTLVGLAIIIWLVFYLVAKTLKPIQEACEAIDHVAKGDYHISLKLTGIRELDVMALGINHMTKERRKAEIALEDKYLIQDREKEQREMLDFMVNSVITIDEAGSILSFNKAAEQLFGYNFEEIIGQNINILVPEPHAGKLSGYLGYYIQTTKDRIIGEFFSGDVNGLNNSKKAFPMRLLVAELPKDEAGKRRFIGTCVDLTQIKQQEEILRRSQKMDALGQLTGGIAHDYNNMLVVVLGYSELLKQMTANKPKLQEYIDEIMRAGQRGAKLTNKLLTFSRNKSRDLVKVDINAILQEEKDMLQKALTTRIILELRFEENLWSVYLDQDELVDSILNMSINAMHAIEGNGMLTIETNNRTLNKIEASRLHVEAGDYISLCLTDNGSGMDSNTQERVFEPFFTTKGEMGTGLGLSQVYGFIQRSNGTIQIHSEEGCGTCLTLYFPRYIEQKDNSVAQVSMHPKSDLRGSETILVVDDEAGIRSFAAETLALQGYHVICAGNGRKALEELKQGHVDLLFSDVIMPDMDGFELATIVRNKYPLIKIQLASGYSDGIHVKDIEENLKNNILLKPYGTISLLKIVRKLLDVNF